MRLLFALLCVVFTSVDATLGEPAVGYCGASCPSNVINSWCRDKQLPYDYNIVQQSKTVMDAKRICSSMGGRLYNMTEFGIQSQQELMYASQGWAKFPQGAFSQPIFVADNEFVKKIYGSSMPSDKCLAISPMNWEFQLVSCYSYNHFACMRNTLPMFKSGGTRKWEKNFSNKFRFLWSYNEKEEVMMGRILTSDLVSQMPTVVHDNKRLRPKRSVLNDTQDVFLASGYFEDQLPMLFGGFIGDFTGQMFGTGPSRKLASTEELAEHLKMGEISGHLKLEETMDGLKKIKKTPNMEILKDFEEKAGHIVAPDDEKCEFPTFSYDAKQIGNAGAIVLFHRTLDDHSKPGSITLETQDYIFTYYWGTGEKNFGFYRIIPNITPN